jgi:hypothetical protein
MKKQPEKKLYVVRKYILAYSLKEAIELEQKHVVDDCWWDDDHKKSTGNKLESAIGFTVEDDEV